MGGGLPMRLLDAGRLRMSALKLPVLKITSPFHAKAVTLDSGGRVINPPSQYVLSALNHNKAPFGAGTVVKTLAYLSLLYGAMKTEVLSNPVNLVSAADDVVDTVVHLGISTWNGHPELRTRYFDGFTRSVYKCDPKVKADVPGLTCYAPGGTYYQEMTRAAAAGHPQGHSALLIWLASWAMLAGAVMMVAREYRGPVQVVPGAKEMSTRRALAYGAMWVGGVALYRTLADSAGVYQFTPTGHPTLYGNWTHRDWVINFPLLVSELATDLMLMAPWWARNGKLIQNSVEVLVAGASRRVHDDARPAGPMRQWLQGVLPQLTPEKDPRTGVELPLHLSVRPQIQGFSQSEKDAVRDGKMPDGPISAGVGHTLTLGAMVFLGYTGYHSLSALMAGTSPHVTADGLLTLLGLGATGVLADASVRNGAGRKLYRRMASLLAHQLGPRGRGPFWLAYTAVGTAMTATLGVTSQAIKGFEITAEYLGKIAKRSLLNPWVNRLQLGVLTAYWPNTPVSQFRFFALGYFTVYAGIEFSAQTEQTTELLVKADAREFALSDDPDHRAELLGQISAHETLVRDAIAHEGFGRPETLERAKGALKAILSIRQQYGIPDGASHDGH